MRGQAAGLVEPARAGAAVDVVPALSVPFPLAGHLRAARRATATSGPASTSGPRRSSPGHRLARGTRGRPAARDVGVPGGRGRRAPVPSPADDVVSRAGHRRPRRRPAHRRRAGHVPRPAAGGRQRDHPQPALRLAWPRWPSGPTSGRACGADRSSCPWPWRSCSAGPPRSSRSCAPPPDDTELRGQPIAAGEPVLLALRLGQPRRGGVRPAADRLDVGRTPTPTWLRLRDPLLPGGRRWPAWRPGRPGGAAGPVRRRRAGGPVVRAASPVIAGVRGPPSSSAPPDRCPPVARAGCRAPWRPAGMGAGDAGRGTGTWDEERRGVACRWPLTQKGRTSRSTEAGRAPEPPAGHREPRAGVPNRAGGGPDRGDVGGHPRRHGTARPSARPHRAGRGRRGR